MAQSFNTLPPQEQLILRHLIAEGNISDAEARLIHRVRSVSRRISTLLAEGCGIQKQQRKDINGQRYVRYVLRYVPAELNPSNMATRYPSDEKQPSRMVQPGDNYELAA